MGTGEITVVLFVIGLIGFMVFPISLHFRTERRKRELAHIERMRAIEVGRAFPGELKNSLLAFPQWAVPHLMALAIGVVVPLGVFLFAFLATLIGGFHKDVWIASGMVGLGAVISGTVLSAGAFKTTSGTDQPVSHADSKQFIDEDAYDVVSSRG
jgi:uncharacterized membrane protein YuzA (DUF378 family)